MNNDKVRINPFFEDYKTPHDTVPFDRIRMEDYEEALWKASAAMMSR